MKKKSDKILKKSQLEKDILPLKQREIFDLFGKIDIDSSYDYKKARKKTKNN